MTERRARQNGAAGDMTVWEGSGQYTDETRYRVISATEFSRRLRHAITRQEMSVTWFLGAGCSKSSGIPCADELARTWIADLKYVETGEEHDVDAWAARRFVGYDPDHPGRVYGEVLQALFFTAQEQRRELQKHMKASEPGFGYATLAQLMAHPKWGQRCNYAITTNFDDLAAEALFVFSENRPRVLTAESLELHTVIAPNAPTLVKIFGDAHLPKPGPGKNRPELGVEAKGRLRDRIGETALVIAGYGGRDHSVIDLLEGLGSDQPEGGVYWINAEPPEGALADWLETRGGVWVRHGDFDELMYDLRLAFGLGHPKIDRFERVLKKYEAQYQDLSTRSGFKLTSSTEGAPSPLGLTGGPATAASGRRTVERKQIRFRESVMKLNQVRRQIADGTDGQPGDGIDPDALTQTERPKGLEAGLIDAAAKELQTTFSAIRTQSADTGASNYAGNPEVEELAIDDQSVAQPDQHGAALEQPRTPLPDPGGLMAGSPGLTPRSPEVIARAIAAMSGRSDGRAAVDTETDPHEARDAAGGVGGGASPLMDGPLPAEPTGRLSEDHGAVGVSAFEKAIAGDDSDAVLRARFARFLAVAVGDLARAEEEFEHAMQLAPQNAAILRDYAVFALSQLHQSTRAERLLTRALTLDLRNPKTLICLAQFLLKARGDLDQAEDCLRLAVEVQPEHPRGLIAYAQFLDERRGRRDEAETLLRRAAEARPKNPAALAEYALFRAFKAQNLEGAVALLEDAARLGPDTTVVLYAQAAVAELKGDVEEAERRYRAAIDADPREMRAQLGYARFLRMRREDLSASEAQLRRAHEAVPHASEPLSALAELLDDFRGDRVAAEDHHRQAIELDPYNPKVLSAFAAHMGQRKEMAEEADALFRDALSLAPRSADILRSYGRFRHEACEDVSGAETHLRLAVEVEPQRLEALEELARFLHLVRGDHAEAEIYYREALRLAPDQSMTLNRFAQFLRDSRGDLEEAERVFRRASENNPKNAAALARHAQFLLAEARRAEGLKVLNDAFDAAWAMDPGARPGPLMLELWIYRYAHDPARRDEALKTALGLIEAGERIDGMDLSPTIASAIDAGHSDPQLLRDLIHVASEGGDPAQLPTLA